MIPRPDASSAIAPRRRAPGIVVAVAAGACLGAGATRAADLASALADPPPSSPWVDPATTGPDAEQVLATMLPPRTDSPSDWFAPLEPLHDCGEPRALPPCVPPPPCHPALPPDPLDLVGARGVPSCGPIYGGPCAPRTGSHDDSRLPRLHRVPDRLFDWFYRPR